MKVLMNAELSKPYTEWKQVFDDHKSARDSANMKDLLVGWCEEDQRIHLAMEVPSMEAVQKFMEENADIIEKSRHKTETTVVKVLTD